jgi:hypothetical protein
MLFTIHLYSGRNTTRITTGTPHLITVSRPEVTNYIFIPVATHRDTTPNHGVPAGSHRLHVRKPQCTRASTIITPKYVYTNTIYIYPYDSPLSHAYIPHPNDSAPPIHFTSLYSPCQSFYAIMSWNVQFNNIPDHGTEPQRGDDSPIAIATLYPSIITMPLPPGSPPSRIRVQHHNNLHYGPITILILSRCATPLNLS